MKRRIVLIAITLFAVIGLANAQNGQRRTVEERVKMAMEKITPALKLDDGQQKQTDSTFTEYYNSMQKLRESMQPGTPPDRSQFQQIATDRDAKLQKIFTADQYKKFKDEVEPAMRPQRGGGGGGNQLS